MLAVAGKALPLEVPPASETLTVGVDQILRVDDDPNHLEAGSLTVIVNGGKA
jgi:hypothetical protein